MNSLTGRVGLEEGEIREKGEGKRESSVPAGNYWAFAVCRQGVDCDSWERSQRTRCCWADRLGNGMCKGPGVWHRHGEQLVRPFRGRRQHGWEMGKLKRPLKGPFSCIKGFRLHPGGPGVTVGYFVSVEIFLEIIVDSHAVVRSNTQTALTHFAQFSPVVTFCKTIQ